MQLRPIAACTHEVRALPLWQGRCVRAQWVSLPEGAREQEIAAADRSARHRGRHAARRPRRRLAGALGTVLALLVLAPLAALTAHGVRTLVQAPEASTAGLSCPVGTPGGQLSLALAAGVVLPLGLAAIGLLVAWGGILRQRPAWGWALCCGSLAVASHVAARVLWPGCTYG